MNAYDAYHLFSTGIRTDVPYWGGKFHILVEKMIEYLQEHSAHLKKKTYVTDVVHTNDKYSIICNDKTIYANNIIACAPKNSLLHFSCFQSMKCILQNSVTCKPLCRVYAVFDKNEPILDVVKTKTVTNNALRYVIPMDPSKGLIMISYTDDVYTTFWEKKRIIPNY